jgi:peptide/nickel transport system substrate-binding protein
MHLRRLSPALSLSILVLAACAPTAPAVSPNAHSEGNQASQPQGAPQPTLVIIARGEPPSLAARELVPFSGALRPPVRLFNATLDYVDERGQAHAYLSSALPQINTDSWRIFPDGRMETSYHLQPNLTWHDGTPLSAEDFVFAWRVYSNPELGVAKSPPFGQMEDVLAVDPNTVVLRWRQVFADAGVLDADLQALPRHILEDEYRGLDSPAFSNLPVWSTEYVGLGPYRLDRWEPGTFLEAHAFDGHALGRPKIDRVKVLFIGDANTALANILSGEAHFISDFILTASDGTTLEHEWSASDGGTVLWAPVNLRVSVVQLRPEYADPPDLIDLRVRRALAHAIDSSTAADVLNEGRAVVTSTLTSPRVDYYGEIERVITKYPYDPRRAQQLLEEAGFARGSDGFYVNRNGQPFSLGVWSSSGPKNEQENAAFVDSLRQAGINASRQVVPAAQIRDAQARALIPGLSTRGQAMKRLLAYTSEQVPRPDNRWQGENRGGWSNPDYDRLFDAYMTTPEQSQRVKAVAQMEKLITEQLPAIPHYFGVNVTAHVAALKGPTARQNPDAGFGWGNASTWEWRQ